MRIGNNTMVERAMRDVMANRLRFASVQRDISSGTRIHRGSDDPTNYVRANVLRRTQSANAAYASNAQAARDFLANTDSALTTVNDVLVRVRNIALNGASGHLQVADRQVLAGEVSQLRETLRLTANSRDETGRYLFGGLKTQTEPYPGLDVTLGPNDTGTISVEVAEGSTLPLNVTGVSVFGDTLPPNDTHMFAILDQLIDRLNAGTNNTDISDLSLADIDTQIDNLTKVRTEVGTRIQRLDLTITRYEDLKLQYDTYLEKAENTDIATASLRLNQYDAALQASLAIGARALPPSLVDFLR